MNAISPLTVRTRTIDRADIGEHDTFPKLLRRNARDRGEQVALRWKELGVWREATWEQYHQRVRDVAFGLIGLGATPGSDSIAILADNCVEWVLADLGAQSIGVVSVGVYPTNTAPQVEYIVQHAGCSVAVVYDQEQLDKLLESDLPGLRAIVVVEEKGLARYEDSRIYTFEDLESLGHKHPDNDPEQFDRFVDDTTTDDVGIIVYTSGTTGQPKGAMISHRNVLAMADGWLQLTPFREDDTVVSYLPLCHILERCMSVFLPLLVGSTVHFGEGVHTISKDLREIAPTVFVGVPRIWEKMHATHEVSISESSRMNRAMFRRGMAIAEAVQRRREQGQSLPLGLRVGYWLARVLVLDAVVDQLGLRRSRFLMCGAAPVAPEILRFFDALGLPVREAYGQTECAGLATIHSGDQRRYGTVGHLSPAVQVRLADDGEILLRGDSVFRGYHRNDEATARTVVDGWLHTGDVGTMDGDCLRITDRKKDIIITAGGKNVSPQEVENHLKLSPYVKEAVVIGDRRKYLVALVQIDYENTGLWAEREGIGYTNYKDLATTPEVADMVTQEVRRLSDQLARVEQVKKVSILTKELDEDDDELTATQKVRRRVIEERYHELIESLYTEVP
nr:AMP-binding protein [Euzebya rosea]